MVGFHTFRHTCASLPFASGQNVKQVQKWLGDADARFTMDTRSSRSTRAMAMRPALVDLPEQKVRSTHDRPATH
jgi:integrase